jgi:O-antigen/teichoic acid export membrane protein
MASHNDNSALINTLARLVRLLLVLIAIPALLVGAAAALAVLVIAAPILLARKVYRLLRASRDDGRMQIWSAL